MPANNVPALDGLRAKLIAANKGPVMWETPAELGYISFLAASEPDLTDDEVRARLEAKRGGWRRQDPTLLSYQLDRVNTEWATQAEAEDDHS